jgi:hypothetical protein
LLALVTALKRPVRELVAENEAEWRDTFATRVATGGGDRRGTTATAGPRPAGDHPAPAGLVPPFEPFPGDRGSGGIDMRELLGRRDDHRDGKGTEER